MSTDARPQLKRVIGRLGFFSLAFGSMIGVGWVTALGGWFDKAGPVGSIIAFLIGGAMMLVIGLCGSNTDASGGRRGGRLRVQGVRNEDGFRRRLVSGSRLPLGFRI